METIISLRVSAGRRKFSMHWDDEKKVLFIETKEKALKGKANIEILKETKKFFKTETRIVSGEKNKNKIIKVMTSKEEVMKKLIPN
ncbi:MAG: DUF167 family protein [archaeon]